MEKNWRNYDKLRTSQNFQSSTRHFASFVRFGATASAKVLRLRDAQHGGGIGVAVVVHGVAATLTGAVPQRSWGHPGYLGFNW